MKPLFWLAGALLVLMGAGFGYYSGISSANHPQTAKNAEQAAERKVLYYRNPMGLADTSPTPKQDSMGMDYLPVYENELPANDIVRIDSHKIQTLGVQTQAVKPQVLGREIRALANLEIDEARVFDISPRFEGWVTRLLVNAQGQEVNKGEILFDVIIPNLYYAEFAYKQAVKKTLDVATAGADLQRQAELQVVSAMERLDEMGIPLEEMERLQRGGEPFSQIPYRSPAAGVVMLKNIVQGTRFAAGDQLYQLADLSKLWLTIALPEQELGRIKVGDTLQVGFIAEPGKTRKAKVDFVYPTLDQSNRTFKLRALLDNADRKLKPGQSGEAWLQSQPRKTLAIPTNALLDSGREQWVLVALGEGVFQPRQIQVGERNLDWIEVASGLSEGEQVVTQANFLIDSESRLQAALANFKPATATPAPVPTENQNNTEDHHHSMDSHSGMEH